MGGRTGDCSRGERALIWYDSADPMDALSQGHEGQASDLASVIAGAVLDGRGAAIAITAA